MQYIFKSLIEKLYVTHLHKTSQFLHVEFNISLCRAHSINCENQKSILFFYLKLWNFENIENITHNNEKRAVKGKNHILTLFNRTFKKAKKYLKNLSK